MSPTRIIRRRYWPLYVLCLIVLAGLSSAAWSLRVRTSDVDQILKSQQELIFDNCVSNEIQDSVIVAQLQAAKRRAEASLPAGSPELRYQIQVINDGIAALEPPDEADCQPPEGTQP